MADFESKKMLVIAEDGMEQAEFDAGIALLLDGEMDLRGERGRYRSPDDGPDNQGGEPVEIGTPKHCPPGLGGIMINDGRFNRDLALIGAGV